MIHKIGQGAKAHIWHLLLIALTLGLLWVGIGFNLWHDHTAAEQAAVNDTANLARAFDENITRTVEGVDQTLLFLRGAYEHGGTRSVEAALVNGRAFLDDLSLQAALADRDGTVFWSNLDPLPSGISIADREHFRAEKESTDDGLFIGAPVLGRISHRWTIQFTRKLLAADGSFDGVVVVSLDPTYLSRFYDSISIGDGSIILATTSGIVLARSPDRLPLIGHEMAPDMKARMLLGTTNGPYRAFSSIDHVDRLFSSRRLEHYPLMLSVGLAAADVFAQFERNKRLYLIVGALLSAACIVVVSAMLRQQKSLVDAGQILAATLENMSQGIAMIRPDGSVPVLNQRAIDLLGLPSELVDSRPTMSQIVAWQIAQQELAEPLNWDPVLNRMVRQKTGPRDDFTYERVRPNGTVLEIRTLCLPDGDMVRTYTDITERKHNEAALATAQERAAHAERMQALGQLAGGIAHDFNNVLQAVQGGASLIEKRAGDIDSVTRFARMILDATSRGTSITRRLLAFARRGELRAEPVDARALLFGLRQVLSHTLGGTIAVDVEFPSDLPPLLADKGQLETVLVNLAANARDAMPGGGTLTLAAAIETVENGTDHAADLPPGCYIRLSVADTGSGIDRRILSRVLEPFFTTKPTGQGTGLGLSMAKGFAEQSGGGLLIDTDPQRGTTVSLWLPAVTAAAPPDQLPPQAAAAPGDMRKCVLLVDDEEMAREALKEALESFNYTVLIAAGGAEALDILDSPNVTVDVLVTDLSMPGTDGLAVIQHAQRCRPGLPAVLLTGYTGPGAQLAVSGSVTGTFTLVHKPVTGGDLADRIEALLAVPSVG